MILPLLALLGGCGTCPIGSACVVMGSGDAGFNGEGLPARESWLYLPTDVLRGPDGALTVVDYNNYRLRELASDGTLTTVAGSGEHAFAEPGTAVLDSPLENPMAAVYGPDDRLYIAAQHEGRVLVVDEGQIQVVAGTGFLGFSGDGGDALAAELWDPTGLAFGPDGALYISDSATNRVRVVKNGIITTIIGGGDATTGPGASVALDHPQRISFSDGTLLVADSYNNRVIAWDAATGEVLEVATELHQPQAALRAPDGSVIVADALAHQVWAFGETDRVIVGSGNPGTADRRRKVFDTPVYYPSGLWLDENGDLFVTTMLGNQVLWVPGAF